MTPPLGGRSQRVAKPVRRRLTSSGGRQTRSSDNRLLLLHGTLDAAGTIALMRRPVATSRGMVRMGRILMGAAAADNPLSPQKNGA